MALHQEVLDPLMDAAKTVVVKAVSTTWQHWTIKQNHSIGTQSASEHGSSVTVHVIQ